MATDSTQKTYPEKNQDRTAESFDTNQLTPAGTAGTNAEMEDDLDTAQTAGSRNNRVTGSHGIQHNTEPISSAPYRSDEPRTHNDAQGVTNHSLGAEHAGQEKVESERQHDQQNDSADGTQSSAPADITGGLPGKKAEGVETVEVSSLRPIK